MNSRRFIVTSAFVLVIVFVSGNVLAGVYFDHQGPDGLQGGFHSWSIESGSKGLPAEAIDSPLSWKTRSGRYGVLFIADGGALARTHEFIRHVLQRDPFRSLSPVLDFSVIEGDPGMMDCRNSIPESPRLVICNKDYIKSLAEPQKPQIVAVFTSKVSGGSGGSIAVSSIDYPIDTMLHEMFHVWGLGDEYEYSESEAAFHCNESGRPAQNTVSFNPRETYETDLEARNIHLFDGKDVPWTIAKEVLITHKTIAGLKLGTRGKAYPEATEILFRGGNCEKVLPTWKPYSGPTIMSNIQSGTPIYRVHSDAAQKAILSATGPLPR